MNNRAHDYAIRSPSAFYNSDPNYTDRDVVEADFKIVERVIGDAEAFCRLHRYTGGVR